MGIINFIYIIGYLWHMGGKYLVTVIPDLMQMKLGDLTKCSTYMAMFWGKTLWLAVHVEVWRRFEAGLDPKWDTKAFWILAVYASDVFETSWLGNSQLD